MLKACLFTHTRADMFLKGLLIKICCIQNQVILLPIKTLPRAIAFVNWISVRFYETDCILSYIYLTCVVFVLLVVEEVDSFRTKGDLRFFFYKLLNSYRDFLGVLLRESKRGRYGEDVTTRGAF